MSKDLTPEQFGDLAKLRAIAEKLDGVLYLTGDAGILNTVNQECIDTIQTDILRARLVTANALCELGDTSYIITDAPRQVRRG